MIPPLLFVFCYRSIVTGVVLFVNLELLQAGIIG